MLILAAAMSFAASAQDLTILHFNDTHSHIDPERSGTNAGLGGVIEQAAYIDSVRCAVGKRMYFFSMPETSVRELHISLSLTEI